MVDTIYIEESIRNHPRVASLVNRFSGTDIIECGQYTEVFNPRAQNFRLQKNKPALILAEKTGKLVLPTPKEYQIGADENYYFSHMLNCLYDCRYCFLQGMYSSANYVMFVNYESFQESIKQVVADNSGKKICFFSGYDCDSLALESVTNFAEQFVPFFSELPETAWLELRTKSIQTRVLESMQPLSNVIVSYTLTPSQIAKEIEHGAPSLEQRLKKVRALTEQGWSVGLRFDPLLPWPGYVDVYAEFFEQVFSDLSIELVHSATIGPMRFPSAMYDRILKLYPDDPLFARFDLTKFKGQACFEKSVEQELIQTIHGQLSEHLPSQKIFNQNQ